MGEGNGEIRNGKRPSFVKIHRDEQGRVEGVQLGRTALGILWGLGVIVFGVVRTQIRYDSIIDGLREDMHEQKDLNALFVKSKDLPRLVRNYVDSHANNRVGFDPLE